MKFVAKFWRGNPQLKSGGYYTERTIEARTLKSAQKKAEEIERNCCYGSMMLVEINKED